MRRSLIALAVLSVIATLAVAPPAAASEHYPSQPVKIFVPFAAGASTDGLARVIAHALQTALGGSFIIENRPGANGIVAAEAVARAAPDGYTLFVTTNTSQSANPSLYRKLPYDPIRSFTPIARLTSGQFMLVLNPSVKATTVAELVAYAEAHPGKLSYATSNSTSLVSAEWFKAIAGIDIVGVPYKSNTTAIADLTAGHVLMMFADQANAVPLIRDGKLRALAVTGQTRSGLLPELPTMEEAGIRGFALNSWAGLFGPAGMPQTQTDRLNAVVNTALKNRDVAERLSSLFGYAVVTSTPAELEAFSKTEIARWQVAITASKIEPQ